MRRNLFYFPFLYLLYWGTGLLNGQAVYYQASWPDTTWTLNIMAHTGQNSMDIESDPRTASHFAYDDDDTGENSHDELAAESPVIDLSEAISAGEPFIIIEGDYVYNNVNASEKLALQYWDADNGQWVDFYVFPTSDTPDVPTDNFCAASPQAYQAKLNINSFSANQLSGFKYRIYFTDNINGEDSWVWGFCFAPPLLYSSTLLPPEMLLEALPDCDNNQFSVQVIITDLGGSSSVTVSDNQAGNARRIGSPDTLRFGPYSSGTTVIITATSDNDTTVSASKEIQFICPPPNDECSGSEEIQILSMNDTCIAPLTVNISGATSSHSSNGYFNCYGIAMPDVWYSFEAPSSGKIYLAVDSLTGDNLVASLYENCNDMEEMACQIIWSKGAMLFDSLTPGSQYYLRLGSSERSFFSFCLYDHALVPNDDCDSAIEVQCGDRISGSTVFALPSVQETYTGRYQHSPDVWYKIRGTGEKVILSTCENVNGGWADYDTKIDVYTSSCDSLIHVAGNDDFSMCNLHSVVEFFTDDSAEYFIRMYGFANGSKGNFILAVDCEPGCETFAPNDDCEGAIPIEYYTEIEADNTCQHDALEHPDCDPFGTISDLWYEVTTPSNVLGFSIVARFDDSLYTANYLHFAVYDSCGGNIRECNYLDSYAKEVRNLSDSTTYKLQIWSGVKGRFLFKIYPYLKPRIDVRTEGDCEHGQYYVNVRLTDMGGASSVTLWTDPPSGQETLTDTSTEVRFGPFNEDWEAHIFAAVTEVPEIYSITSVGYHCPPSNDACETAREIDTIPFTESLDASGATNNQGNIDVCIEDTTHYAMNDGVWYTFVPQEVHGSLTVLVTPEGWDTEVQVYSGSCDNLTCVAHTDTGSEDGVESITFNPVAGETYFINVGHWSGSEDRPEGPFTIEVTGDVTLSNEVLTREEFSFYPNPTQGVVRWTSAEQPESIQVLNLAGQVIFEVRRPKGQSLDLQRLPQGVYMLRVSVDGKQGLFKLIKE